MRLGADGMNEDDIARRLADVGANLNVSFDVDRAGFTLRTLSSDAEQTQALDCCARCCSSPTFPEAVLEREKARVIAGLKEADTKPDDHRGAHFRACCCSASIRMLCAAPASADTVAALDARRRAAASIVTTITQSAPSWRSWAMSRAHAQPQIAEELTRGLPNGGSAAASSAAVPPLADCRRE